MPNPLLNLHSNAAAVITAEDTLIRELPALLATATFNVNGTVLTMAQAVAKLTAHQAAFAACAKARAALHEAVLAQKALRLEVQATTAAIAAYVVAIHGANSPYLATLGFAPASRQEPSSATRALAVEKSKATRQARGTKGRRQRLAIRAPASVPDGSPQPGARSPLSPADTSSSRTPLRAPGCAAAPPSRPPPDAPPPDRAAATPAPCTAPARLHRAGAPSTAGPPTDS
jgi:hypothetical protein